MTPEEKSAIKKNTGMDYGYLHTYLRNTFGPADRCSNPDCTHKNPKRFEWALIKGRQYSKDIADYISLCPSCHRKMDFVPDMAELCRKRMTGKRFSEETKSKMGKHRLGVRHTDESRTKMSKIILASVRSKDRPVMDTNTGKTYRSLNSAWKESGFKRSIFNMMLTGKHPNKTTFKLI